MLHLLLLLLSAVACHAKVAPTITWLTPQRSAIVKLDTPGCPLWIPAQAANHPEETRIYRETSTASAILVDLAISPDNRTLLLGGASILPLQNYHVPPRLGGAQVPASITPAALKTYHARQQQSRDSTTRTFEGTPFLGLDYDRLVEADPFGGPPFHNHEPTLRFRILGVHGPGRRPRHVVLDRAAQYVLHVTLKDQHPGTSDDPLRSYAITDVAVKPFGESYTDAAQPEADGVLPHEQQGECTAWSWTCPDRGMLEPQSPFHRYIWRERFDEYGRKGSARHACVRWIGGVKRRVRDDPQAVVLAALATMLATGIAVYVGVKRLIATEAGATQREVVAKQKAGAKAKGHELGESEDEDSAWLADQSRQTGEVEMTVDEVSQLIDLVDEDDEAEAKS